MLSNRILRNEQHDCTIISSFSLTPSLTPPLCSASKSLFISLLGSMLLCLESIGTEQKLKSNSRLLMSPFSLEDQSLLSTYLPTHLLSRQLTPSQGMNGIFIWLLSLFVHEKVKLLSVMGSI